MTIYLFQYNNYYNRQVKGFELAIDYPDPLAAFYQFQFNPNDGYKTQITLNTDIGEKADYCVVCEDSNAINSRWFVMEVVRTRQGQYTFYLQRDVVYDYKESILVAPCFIEKATLDANNPLIYNREQVSTNQIKTEEILLKDRFALPWVVAYIKKETDKVITIPKPKIDVDFVLNTLEQYDYYPYKDSIKSNPRVPRFYMNFYYGDTTYICGWDRDGDAVKPNIVNDGQGVMPYGVVFRSGVNYGFPHEKNTLTDTAEMILERAKTKTWNYSAEDYIFPNDDSFFPSDSFLEDDGKVVFETDSGKYYKIKYKVVGLDNSIATVPPASAVGSKYRDIAREVGLGDSYLEPIGYMSVDYRVYHLLFEEMPAETLNLPLSSTRAHTANAPYDIVAFPMGGYKIWRTAGESYEEVGENTSSEVAYSLSASFSSQLGSDLLDIQLLPYAPINTKYIYDYQHLDIGEAENSFMSLLTDPEDETNNPWAVAFFVEKQDFTANLYQEKNGRLESVIIEAPTDAVDLKIMNECSEYRIVSPNYASIFSINPAQNKGLKNLRADCSYKPYNPYIRVYPEFDGLYGNNFGDNRGMIISGDFSLPRTTNEWIEYQLQNKNYLNIFDRQVENLNTTNRLNRMEANANILTGIVSGGATGAMTMGMAGGPWGAVAGGVLGAGASAIGGVGDYHIMKARQREALDYTQDMFALSLGNIKARHDTVAKISAFDINSKIWPFIEVYQATDEEKQALRQKLNWNGMTVGVIGTIKNYIRPRETYIKGRIIRLDNLGIDYMLSTMIADEINKGVFI